MKDKTQRDESAERILELLSTGERSLKELEIATALPYYTVRNIIDNLSRNHPVYEPGNGKYALLK
jgi:DNA-binding IclR family transcriptional regulator